MAELRHQRAGRARMPVRAPHQRRVLVAPAVPKLGCDECFAQLDRYVELEVAGGEPAL